MLLFSDDYLGIPLCAGMNDICSPMIVLLENEADAFWCFEHTMRRLVCKKFVIFFFYIEIVVK